MLQRSHAIRNGIILFLLLGFYFLILDLIGLADNVYLRLVNYIFIIGILKLTIKTAVKNGENYLRKLIIGIATVTIGIGLGAIGLFIYLNGIDAPIEDYVEGLIPADTYAGLSFALFIEALSSSIIIVFIMLQFYKNEQTEKIK
ncbi:hypothetical protein [Brumimicrobium aurantiacum]|uniref:DUF4199 domain-containing protein n=1 Tax=Brumimicrobium aurantiacum TaxID=1737063 RepID=A0A3E1F0R7_9FLAO|nr:hypothetical protein [Brumimicrobium aurantiacum]RFC55333.1 hypothetical protein DXU93_05790 [Brumimicrobium aurantiacum]